MLEIGHAVSQHRDRCNGRQTTVDVLATNVLADDIILVLKIEKNWLLGAFHWLSGLRTGALALLRTVGHRLVVVRRLLDSGCLHAHAAAICYSVAGI